MSKKDEKIKKAKEDVKAMLADDAKFEKEFEKVFKKYDKNFDKKIDEGEYYNFLNEMLQSFGRKPYDFNTMMMNYERADKDKDGGISKDEFKAEFKKRLRTFAS